VLLWESVPTGGDDDCGRADELLVFVEAVDAGLGGFGQHHRVTAWDQNHRRPAAQGGRQCGGAGDP